MMLMPSMFMSRKSKTSVVEKFRELNIHKRRKPLEVIASELRPIIQGIINYYCKFSTNLHAKSGINSILDCLNG